MDSKAAYETFPGEAAQAQRALDETDAALAVMPEDLLKLTYDPETHARISSKLTRVDEADAAIARLEPQASTLAADEAEVKRIDGDLDKLKEQEQTLRERLAGAAVTEQAIAKAEAKVLSADTDMGTADTVARTAYQDLADARAAVTHAEGELAGAEARARRLAAARRSEAICGYTQQALG